MRKLNLFVCVIVFISINNFLNAQVKRKSIKQYNTVYSEPYLDSIAKFHRGEEALIDYFRTNFNSSQQVVDAAKNISQYFIIDLKISKEGNVDSIVFYQTSLYEANKELRRLCENMPNWTPGYKDGLAVDSWVVLPYAYKIKDRFWEPEHNSKNVLVTENKMENLPIKIGLITLAITVVYLAWSFN